MARARTTRGSTAPRFSSMSSARGGEIPMKRTAVVLGLVAAMGVSTSAAWGIRQANSSEEARQQQGGRPQSSDEERGGSSSVQARRKGIVDGVGSAGSRVKRHLEGAVGLLSLAGVFGKNAFLGAPLPSWERRGLCQKEPLPLLAAIVLDHACCPVCCPSAGAGPMGSTRELKQQQRPSRKRFENGP